MKTLQAKKIAQSILANRNGWTLYINRADALVYIKWEYGQKVASFFAKNTQGKFKVSLFFCGSEKTKRKTVEFKNRVCEVVQHVRGRLGKDLKTFSYSIKKIKTK